MIKALEQIRRMRGGAQSHLMRCSDGNYYVVKFQNNLQHRRILVNELLGTRLASRLGLPTAPVEVVEVGAELIRLTPELCIELPRSRTQCAAGLQFGSRYAGDPRQLTLHDFLPDEKLREVENLHDFAGMLVFDKWACNTNGRQTVFFEEEARTSAGTSGGATPPGAAAAGLAPRLGQSEVARGTLAQGEGTREEVREVAGRGRAYRTVMIDQGFGFNAGEWNFPDAPLRGLYARSRVYEGVTGMVSFGPWLERLEKGVRAEEFTFVGDPMRIDYGYRRNGTRGFVQTLSVSRAPGDVKSLAYTVERIRNRLAASEFTAVTDVHLLAENERHQFVRETLRDAGVEAVPLEGLAVWTAKMRPMIQ
jgi:hypothetical protein